MPKGKMIVWGGLTKAEKRREVKGKGEKERLYPSECRVPKNSKERIESLPKRTVQRNRGNNRMQKTRDLFKKIRYQGNISCKDRHNKEEKQYVSVLTEAEDIKKKW